MSDNPTTWLNGIDNLREATNGKAQHKVFQRWDSPWEELKDVYWQLFIFFSDKLHICIDAWNKGLMLHIVRRSCQPNTHMQIIIVRLQYPFYLMPEQAITQMQEITIV
jgi:hypothetical protein